MASKPKPLPKQIAEFVKFHLADKHAFAPFTGQDYSAWHAYLYAVQLYGRGDANGQASALVIMRSCIIAAQKKADVLAIFQKSIPGVLDWGYESRLWALAYPHGEVTFYAALGERICSHIHSKPSKKHSGYFKCRDCGAEWYPPHPSGTIITEYT